MNLIPTDIEKLDLKDPRCFEAIYNCYWKKVYLTCLRHTKDEEVSREMAQDIFKSLWERREELAIAVSIERYLAKSAKFKVFEFIRNRATQQLHVAAAAREIPLAVNATENDVMYNELKADVDTVVNGLPDQCRRVFRLSRIDGFTNREIAAQLEVSERAVEHHITRALRTLKQVLMHEPARMA